MNIMTGRNGKVIGVLGRPVWKFWAINILTPVVNEKTGEVRWVKLGGNRVIFSMN